MKCIISLRDAFKPFLYNLVYQSYHLSFACKYSLYELIKMIFERQYKMYLVIKLTLINVQVH